MVYTCDSKSHALRLVGSSPTFGTRLNFIKIKTLLIFKIKKVLAVWKCFYRLEYSRICGSAKKEKTMNAV